MGVSRDTHTLFKRLAWKPYHTAVWRAGPGRPHAMRYGWSTLLFVASFRWARVDKGSASVIVECPRCGGTSFYVSLTQMSNTLMCRETACDWYAELRDLRYYVGLPVWQVDESGLPSTLD